MRIAYVCADAGVPIFGHKGCSVHVQEMVRALRRRGAAVDMFAARVEGQPPPGLEDVPVTPLPVVGDGEPAGHAAAIAELNRELVAVLTRSGPYDIIYERYSLWSFAGMELARATGTPGLLEVNAPLIEEQAAHRGLRDAEGATRAAARVLPAAAALLAVSKEVAAWVRRGWRLQGAVHVLPNGVDPQRFRPDVPPANPALPGRFTVGFVGSMKPWHGLGVLIHAFAQLRARVAAAGLLLVGGGPEEAAVRAALADRGLAPFSCLVGAVPPGQVPAYVTSMDVAVAPYAAEQGFYFSPLKVYEYMAAGRAVAASRVGQLKTVIRQGVNGLLLPPGDAGALAAALERLHGDIELRTRLGREARASILRRHTWERVAARVLQVASMTQRGGRARVRMQA